MCNSDAPVVDIVQPEAEELAEAATEEMQAGQDGDGEDKLSETPALPSERPKFLRPSTGPTKPPAPGSRPPPPKVAVCFELKKNGLFWAFSSS